MNDLHMNLGDGAPGIILAVASFLLSALLGEIASRGLKQRSARFLGWGVAVIAATAILGFAFRAPLERFTERVSGRASFALFAKPGDPVVVGVFPAEAFGPLQKDGLHAALEPHASTLRVIDLEAPLAAMKANDAAALTSELRSLILTQNVVAIVGPPVTEFTRSVVEAVDSTGRPVPIFITSAAPRSAVGWAQARTPLFRVNSGVDERVAEFVSLAEAAVEQNTEIVFLVEQSPNAAEQLYGQILLKAIGEGLPGWAERVRKGQVSRLNYTRGRIVEDITRWGPDRLFGARRVIVVLGLGSDYRAVMDAFYKAEDPQRQALLGGWMNAYDAEPSMAARRFQYDRLFEITDLSPAGAPDKRAEFEREFGASSPAMRDQAFAFDAGDLIAHAFEATLADLNRKADTLKADDAFLKRLASHVRADEFSGVTGVMRFAPNGQNLGGGAEGGQLMQIAVYAGPDNGWRYLPDARALLQPPQPPTPLTGPPQ